MNDILNKRIIYAPFGGFMGIQAAVKMRMLELIAKKNLNPNRLANIAGIPSATVKGIIYERSTNTGIVTIKKLCDGLDISIIDFFDDDIFRKLEQEIE